MQNRKKLTVCIFGLALIIAISVFNSCQENKAATIQQTLTGEDSLAINALVLYPDTIRNNIFEISKYPKGISAVAQLQEKSSKQFAEIVEPYSQDEQEQIWDMTRYPGLVNHLQDVKTEKEIKMVLENYPEEVHASAIKFGKEHQDLIKQLNDLQRTSDEEFEKIIRDYPSETQNAFREMIKLPEVLTILNEHPDMTENIGKLYERDPDLVIKTADSLQAEVAKQNAEDLASWKQELNAHPETQQELKSAAGDYADENGYDETEYTSAPSYYYIHEYAWYPYPYWYGYPYWYPYDYWYPYPYWYDWGFYYDAYGNIVVISTPSYAFTYWYFYYPHNYYHHPHLANAFINYYYGPRTRSDQNAIIVRNWVDDNRKYLPDDFIENDKNRANEIKEFGKMQTDWEKYRDDTKGKHLTQDEYLTQHKNDYPALQNKSENKIQKTEPGIIQHKSTGKSEPPVKQPHVKMNPQKPADDKGKQTDRIHNSYDFDQVNPAQQRHRNMWDQNPKNEKPQKQNKVRNKRGGGQR